MHVLRMITTCFRASYTSYLPAQQARAASPRIAAAPRRLALALRGAAPTAWLAAWLALLLQVLAQCRLLVVTEDALLQVRVCANMMRRQSDNTRRRHDLAASPGRTAGERGGAVPRIRA